MAFPPFYHPNVDIKLLLQWLCGECPNAVTILPAHIKGHQDDNENFNYDKAPQLVRRNIDMRQLSETFLKSDQDKLESGQVQQLIPGQKLMLILDQSPVQNNVHHDVNSQLFSHDLEHRFQSKTEIPVSFPKVAQWKVFERVYSGTSKHDKLNRFNLIHSKWQTNMAQAKWDSNKNLQC